MPIVSFDVSSADAERTLVVEAHGSVYYPQEFSNPITKIDNFFMTYRLDEDIDPEDLAWVETDESWLINNLGEEVFMILMTNIEDSLLEQYLEEEEGKEITHVHISPRSN